MTVAQPLCNEDNPLRAIDYAVADFLARHYPSAQPAQCRLAAWVSYQLSDGHLCLALDDTAITRQIEHYENQSIAQLIDHNPLLGHDAKTPLIRAGERVYLQRYWQLENTITAHIQHRLDETLFAPHDLQRPLEQLFPTHANTTDWQHIACLLGARKRIGIITGGPGTGKTTTVVRLLALLKHLADRNSQELNLKLAAPTGKAAARLAESIAKQLNTPTTTLLENLHAHIPNAQTLHRLLGGRPDSRHFKHNAQHPLDADLVVVDEASMIGIDMMAALLDALPAHCRLILVGDKDQLASVEAGAVMAQLCQQANNQFDSTTCDYIQRAGGPVFTPAPSAPPLAQQTVKLQTSWRAKDAPGILALADAINQQDTNACQTAWQNHAAQLTHVQTGPDWINTRLINADNGLAALIKDCKTPPHPVDIDAWANARLKQLSQQQLLTPLRHGDAGVEGLNQLITDTLLRQGHIDTADIFIGKPILVTQNLYDLDLMNGDLGLILPHPELGLRAAFITDDQRIRWIVPEQLAHRSQPAFAITVHQSQGSEYQHVLLRLPADDKPLIKKELLYTAVTRAKQHFTLVAPDRHIFNRGVQRKTHRHSGLATRLNES